MSSANLAVSALSTLAELASLPCMVDLSLRYQHYADRMDAAMKARKLTNEGLAEKMGGQTHSVTVSKLRRGHTRLDDEWRAKVATGIGLAEDVLFGDGPLPAPDARDIFVSPKKAARRAQRPANDNATIPLYGLAAGSLSGAHSVTTEAIDEVPCPPGLANVPDAYALRTKGGSMMPRYFDGDVLYVNPRQPIRPGDHVIVQVQRYQGSGTETWVKRFDSQTPEEILVTQYNPTQQIRFRKQYVLYMHRVMAPNELFGIR